jgi:hypothetical protein
LFQKIDAGASGLIVTITTDEKTRAGAAHFPPKPLHPRLRPSYWPRDVRGAICRWNTRLLRSEVAVKREVDRGSDGETAGKLTIASGGGTTLYDPCLGFGSGDLEAGG